MKDCKKLFADTAVVTTLLLKKCVKVPKLEMKNDAQPEGLPYLEYMKETSRQMVKPFQRGAMQFDDYNYDQFNKYILVDPNRDETAPDAINLGGFVPQTVSLKSSKKGTQNVADEDQALPLTEKELEVSCHGSYKHDLLDTQTKEEKDTEAVEAAFQHKQAIQVAKEAEEKERLEKEEENEHSRSQSLIQKGTETENDYGMEEGEEDDDIEYDIFYTSQKIKDTLIS